MYPCRHHFLFQPLYLLFSLLFRTMMHVETNWEILLSKHELQRDLLITCVNVVKPADSFLEFKMHGPYSTLYALI